MIQRLSARRSRQDETGFTLIELLVVIIILGILSAVVVFAVKGAGDKGQSAALTADAKTVRTAEEAFCARNGFYAPDEQTLVTAQLLDSVGTDTVIITAGVTGSCGNGTNGPSGYRLQCAVVAAGCVPSGGVIRVAGGTDVTSPNGWLNPAVTSGGGVHPNVEYMFNGLMRWAENNTSQPDLAQSYTISPDQKTATFVLRPGMTWQNSTTASPKPITNADVKFTFEQALLKFHGRTSASIGPALGVTGSGSGATTPQYNGTSVLTGLELTGADTVAFHFKYSYAPLLKQLNVTEAPIIPQNVYSQCDYSQPVTVVPHSTIDKAACPANNPGPGDNPAVTTVGSGPFMLKNRNTSTGALVFVKFPAYHFAGLPLADELDQVPLTTNVNADALNAGTVDVATPLNNRILPIVGPNQTTADITPANGYTLFQPPRGTGGGNCVLTESYNLWAKSELPATINGKAANAPYDNPYLGDPTPVPANPAAGRPNVMPRGQVVRTALSMATDRDTLFAANQFGKGRVATSPYHSAVPGYTPTALPALDTTKAGQWLTDAGWLDTGGTYRQSDHAFSTATESVAVNDPLKLEIIYGRSNDASGNPLTPALSPVGSQGSYAWGIHQQWEAAPVKVNLSFASFPTGDANGGFTGHAVNRDYDILTVSYCNGDDPVVGVRRQYYAATTGASATAASQITGTSFTNSAGYRTTTMDTLWDNAAQTSSAATHAAIQAEAASIVPQLWLDESLGSRAWKTARCAGFNNYNTGLFVETAGCNP